MFLAYIFLLCRDIGGNTPGTAGGPGGRDRTLAVKSLKKTKKINFYLKKIYFFAYIF